MWVHMRPGVTALLRSFCHQDGQPDSPDLRCVAGRVAALTADLGYVAQSYRHTRNAKEKKGKRKLPVKQRPAMGASIEEGRGQV